MPMYDMFCKGCGHEEKDVLAKYEEIVLCSVCSEELQRVMSSTNFKISDARLTKHLRKYGNNSANAPTTKDNGVKLYAKKKPS